MEKIIVWSLAVLIIVVIGMSTSRLQQRNEEMQKEIDRQKQRRKDIIGKVDRLIHDYANCLEQKKTMICDISALPHRKQLIKDILMTAIADGLSTHEYIKVNAVDAMIEAYYSLAFFQQIDREDQEAISMANNLKDKFSYDYDKTISNDGNARKAELESYLPLLTALPIHSKYMNQIINERNALKADLHEFLRQNHPKALKALLRKT